MNARVTNGSNGSVFVSGTSATVAEKTWCAITVISDAKFHTLTGGPTGLANTTSGSATTIPVGLTIYGSFTALQLHSGAVIAYNG